MSRTRGACSALEEPTLKNAGSVCRSFRKRTEVAWHLRLKQAMWPDPVLRPFLGHRSPLDSESAASSLVGTGASLKRHRSRSPLSTSKKRSHKTSCEHSRSRETLLPSLIRAWTSWGLVPSPVPMGVMPVPTMSVTTAYQAVADLLCLSVPSLPLVQDFPRLVASVAPPMECTTKSSGLSALYSGAPLPVIGMEMASELIQGPWYQDPSQHRCVDTTDAFVVAVPTLDVKASQCSGTAVCTWINLLT